MNPAPDYIDAFSAAAALYSTARPTYPETLFQHLAALSPATRGAWDCGTGNGQAALGLAACFESVDATDASAEQIAHATPHPRVHYRVAPAEDSGLPDQSVDLISVAQALHWFDRERFFAEVHRVARPGGLLAAYGYNWFYLTPTLDELTERYLLRPVQAYWSPHNRLLWDGYRTIEFPGEELPAPTLAIHRSWTLHQLFEFYQSWSAPRRKIEADGDAFLREARTAFESAWGDPTQPRHVVMPMSIRLARLP